MTGEHSILNSNSKISASATIWNYVHVRENAVIGDKTIIGDHAYIDQGVVIGANCKIQNASQIFGPAILEDGVFIGPGAILTNDKFPRAISQSGSLKSAQEWEKVGVKVEFGASIGAGAICIAPISIGAWSFVSAGSVVTKSVPRFARVSGNPAKFDGWVGYAGMKLRITDTGLLECPLTGDKFYEISDVELRPHDSII